MNLLMISGDTTLAMDKEKVIGNSQDRHILYGRYLSNLFIVLISPKRMGLKTKRLSENVVVYPTSSRKFLFLWDAYRIAKKICQSNALFAVVVNVIIGDRWAAGMGITLQGKLDCSVKGCPQSALGHFAIIDQHVGIIRNCNSAFLYEGNFGILDLHVRRIV